MPPIGLTLRVCRFGDLDQVTQVENDSFPDRPYTKSDFAHCLLTARDGFIVASKDGLVVGYVIALCQGREASIQSVAVLPDYRRQGIGEALMRSAIDVLAGRSDRVSLLVDVNNAAAIRLYRRLSFRETGRLVRRYYPDGSDAMEMASELRA